MISVVIPVLNEEDNISPLLQEIVRASQICPISEIIYVDDGSTDSTPNVLSSLKQKQPLLRVLRHDQRSGQSASLWTGVKAATNDLIVTIDGDGQNNPADIAKLYNQYTEIDQIAPQTMIVGEREKRNDSLSRRIASRTANMIRSSLLRDSTKDTGCSLKLFRRKDYLRLPYFNHMHRFLPALMMREQVRLIHVPVSHRPRHSGVSKYGNFGRALVGISDLLGVLWLQKRANSYPQISENLE